LLSPSILRRREFSPLSPKAYCFCVTDSRMSASDSKGASSVEAEPKYYTGVVKWFNLKRGFGFVTPDAGQTMPDDFTGSKSEGNENAIGDVFLHYSQIQCKGFKFVSADQKCRFTLYKDKRGMDAAGHVTDVDGNLLVNKPKSRKKRKKKRQNNANAKNDTSNSDNLENKPTTSQQVETSDSANIEDTNAFGTTSSATNQ